MSLSTPKFYVELDVFSGRPNPGWSLAAEEAKDLLSRISRLAPNGGGQSPAGLGYRGFIVYRTITGPPQRWLHVGRGVVSIAENTQVRQCRDTEGIEEWLRQQAIARGYSGLIGPAG